MQFPKQIVPDETTRAGRMLAAGDVRVTVTNTETGDHITVRFKATLDNRRGGTGERAKPGEDRNWVRVPFSEASHVFIEVPSASGDFPDKIGTFYPRTARFFTDQNADPERVKAAQLAAHWLSVSSMPLFESEYRFQEESHCGVCGRTLTDPESIDLGIGPECNRRQTESHHQVKHRVERLPETLEVLNQIMALDSGQIELIRNELEMWHSQERQSTRQ